MAGGKDGTKYANASATAEEGDFETKGIKRESFNRVIVSPAELNILVNIPSEIVLFLSTSLGHSRNLGKCVRQFHETFVPDSYVEFSHRNKFQKFQLHSENTGGAS